MSFAFKLIDDSHLPIDVLGMTPDRLAGRSLTEVSVLSIRKGNRIVQVQDVFQVTAIESPRQVVMLHWQADDGQQLQRLQHAGAQMTSGMVRVDGHVGAFAGKNMKGGKIEVVGNAGQGLGAEMTAGEIKVAGNASDLVGGACGGSGTGMRGGKILIEGSAGNEVGYRMRRGLIAVGQQAGNYLGHQMLAGTILINGNVGQHVGLAMKRGTIVCLQKTHLSNRFRYNFAGPSIMASLLDQSLQESNYEFPKLGGRSFKFYSGDCARFARERSDSSGKGEILIAAT